MFRIHLLEGAVRDIRHSVRSLVRQPKLTGFALLALVVGIGLNVAVFTTFNAFALRPWPVPDPGRVVIDVGNPVSVGEYDDIRRNVRSFDGVTLVSLAQQEVEIEGVERRLEFVAANYFDVVGLRMALGRGFTAWEDDFDAPQAVVVLAHKFWRTYFGGNPDILSRTVQLNGVPFRVIGVMNPDFDGVTSSRDLWAPLASRVLVDPRETGRRRGLSCCRLVARLAAGVTRTQAEAELSLLAVRTARARSSGSRHVTLIGTSLADHGGMAILAPFLIVQLMVGGIFLLACANVANLMLARALSRTHELAVRVSLGARRWHVIQQLLAEGLLLSVGAAALILMFLPPVAGLMRRWVGVAPQSVVDMRVLAYVGGIALVATSVCGLLPALQFMRTGLITVVNRQSVQATPRPLPLRGVLLGLQVGISVVLLVCSGLLVRSAQRSAYTDLGFNLENVARVSVGLDWDQFVVRGSEAAIFQLREALRPSGPVGLAERAPLSRLDSALVTLPPADVDRSERRVEVRDGVVDAGYFEVLGIPLVAGRTFTTWDSSQDVVIVNETMARRYWPEGSALGASVRAPVAGRNTTMAAQERDYEIVGIVRDAQIEWPHPVAPTIFRSHREANRTFTLVVPVAASTRAAAIVREIDPSASVSVTPLSDWRDGEVQASRVLAGGTSLLGILALLLAGTGVYGVVAYAVEARRREIGIRMALGARSPAVIALIVRHNARPLLVGLAVGFLLSTVASMSLRSRLFGISHLDALTYGSILILLLGVGFVASAVPARRATRVDPIEILRAD